jgi:hypothetical protein
MSKDLIVKMEQYVIGDEAIGLTHNKIIRGTAPEGYVEFVGRGRMEIQMPDGSTYPEPVNVPIEAESLEDAAEKVEEVMERALAAHKENIERQMRMANLGAGPGDVGNGAGGIAMP